MRAPQAGLPFTDSDEQIRAWLDDVSIPTLLAACVHMSGDVSILDGPVVPQGAMLNEIQGYLTEEEKAAARELALGVIRDYRDRGCPEPAPLSPEVVHRMMRFVVGADVADEYVPMMLEELGLDGVDVRASTPSRSVPEDFSVVIIGCGMSGLLAAIRLGQAGIPYVVVEKNAGPGGTWFENTYPGARVDVGNHFYSYSFEPSDDWTEYFARQPELLAYFTAVMHKHGVAQHVRWSTEVVGATWDEDTATWDVELADGERLTARAVISAVGQLSRPQVPDVPGTF
ncbi:MAG: NAD(P)-binding protein, partial [Actinobacteria bacterium]|nr:NAD(P)-binding protein [Actinomycetota bacterium]